MNPRQHALLARQLIAACGGLKESSEASGRSDTQLSRYQTPDSGQFMPADVIDTLQSYCQRPIYALGMIDAIATANAVRDLVNEACEAAEAVTELQREVRLAAVDGVVTPAERDRLAKLHAKARDQLRDVADAIEGGAA